MKRYTARPGVVLAEFLGEYALIAPARLVEEGCSYVTQLSETAVLLWKEMAEPRTEEELTGRLLSEYEGADPEEVRADVRALLAELTELGPVLPLEEA